MSSFTESITKVAKGALKSFSAFPIAMAAALAFVIVTIVRIELDWSVQEAYNFLFNCLHLSFALGAVFGLCAITAAQSRSKNKRAFLIANLLGLAAIIGSFFLLYYLGGSASSASSYPVLSQIAAARSGVLIGISLLAFIIFAAYPPKQADFASSFFMTHKALLIALLYGGVIIGGLLAIAGAVEALIYSEMSEKVYMYITAVSGFIVFAIFVGYFPDFSPGEIDEHRSVAQKQPRVIKILLANILVPIFLALTVVLLIWAVQTIFGGIGSSFAQLAGIAAAYTIGGIWLYIMLTHHQEKMAVLYKRIYPLAALVILAFEAWALIVRLNDIGLTTLEYLFFIVWLFALISAILLLLKQAKAHIPIIIIACALAVIAVLPGVGYNSLPVRSQVDRLSTILIEQEILVDEAIVPATSEPDENIRIDITLSVDYLSGVEDARLPDWFVNDLNSSTVFQETFGFSQTWPADEGYPLEPVSYPYISLVLDQQIISIDEYQWAIDFNIYYQDEQTVYLEGERGKYTISWQTPDDSNGVPQLKISLAGQEKIVLDIEAYLSALSEKYPQSGETLHADLDDMSILLTSEELEIWLIFSRIEIEESTNGEDNYYWVEPLALYLQELP